jgi:hypothetical protein
VQTPPFSGRSRSVWRVRDQTSLSRESVSTLTVHESKMHAAVNSCTRTMLVARAWSPVEPQLSCRREKLKLELDL